MKKNLLAISVLAVAVMSGSAMAADTEVMFNGAVSNVTCDVNVQVNGVAGNTVALGTVGVGATGTAKPFTLMPDLTQAGCQNLTTAQTAQVNFIPTQLGAQGLPAAAGSAAADAYVKIDTINAKTTPVQSVTATNSTVNFDGQVFHDDGAQFNAYLQGGNLTGLMTAVASFAVTYN